MISSNPKIVRGFLQLLLAVSLLLSSVIPAHADSLSSFISIYIEIEHYAPPNSLPVSSQDLIASKTLFSCLEQGSDAAVCIDSFSHTPLGQQVVVESGLPSSFWSLLDAYVAYKNGDIWGVAYSLGETAVCAVLQVLAGGADLCGFIKELIQLAESLWDAATAVAEFFADLGEGAWEAAKGAYCDTLGTIFGGCEDDSSPPEAVAYAWVFAPKLADGLAARKAIDPNAFNNLRQQIIAQASANPAQFNIPIPDLIKITFPAAAVTTAAEIYTSAVDQNWSADMINVVLPALNKKRNEYGTPSKITQLAGTAATAFKNNETEPSWVIRKVCGDEFRQTFGFAHVDRWIANPSTAATANKLKVQTSAIWCNSVWNDNKQEFAKTFVTFARNNFCPGAGTPLACKTIENYGRCNKLLGYVGEEKQCGVNVAAMGKEAAEKVKQALLDNGSKGIYSIIAPPASPSGTPATLISQRPPQQHACNYTYQKIFGSYPAKLVTCNVQEPADYTALKAAVAKAVVSLNSDASGAGMIQKQASFFAAQSNFVIDSIDPLLVWAKSEQAYGKVLAKRPSFGFGPPSKSAGFDFPLFKQHLSIDGLDTPAISNEMELKKPTPQTYANQKDKLAGKIPSPDPIDQLTSKQALSRNVAPMAVQKTGKMQMPEMAGASGQQQVMSGTLPGGKNPATSPGLAAGRLATFAPQPGIGAQEAGTPTIKPMMLQLADLLATPEVTVAGRTVQWPIPVVIDATAAQQKGNGMCHFPLQYEIRNAGSAPSAGFVTSWETSTVSGSPVIRSWGSLAPGTSRRQTDTVRLKPGRNQVTLSIDTGAQVKEGNESNNQYRLNVTVNGQCETGMHLPAVLPKR